MNTKRAHGPSRWLKVGGPALVCAAALIFPAPVSSAAEPSVPRSGTAHTLNADKPLDDTGAVPRAHRAKTLGPDWQDGEDTAWTIAGDSAGLHVFSAEMDEGYDWRHIATLGNAAFDTDRWVGNACLSSDQRWLAVTYAPRNFTNDDVLFSRGAFAALVELRSGKVTPVEGTFSLAYFNPGCGPNGKVALTAFAEDGKTHVKTFPADKPASAEVIEVENTVTSVVPTAVGLVGASGRDIVTLAADGRSTKLLEADGLAFDLKVMPNGGLAYLQHNGADAQAMFVATINGSGKGKPTQVASGALDAIGLTQDASGGVYLTGEPKSVSKSLPASLKAAPGTAPRVTASSNGRLLLAPSHIRGGQTGAAQPEPSAAHAAAIRGLVRATRTEVSFSVATEPGTPDGDGFVVSSPRSRSLTTESTTSPISGGGACAVPRNDPAIQALQPRPAEVEWAVNQGIRQTLDSTFPLPSLSGGGRVPAQVMLGILAQESNFWQASKYVVPGVTGNPLVGNYYGVSRSSSAPNAWWQINYANADCGYGIAQVTDGMEAGEMPYDKQLKIATDYKANIARGLQILIEKWNQTRDAGLIINNGDPKHLENWFYALWAYNTGFYAPSAAGSPWGVGWVNNPVNALYPPNRPSFLDDGHPEHAAYPQEWPYPEKVLGFAAHSVQFLDSVDQGPLIDSFNYGPAFAPAWWTKSDGFEGRFNRRDVKPPVDLFCDTSNECDVNATVGPCLRSDSKCWFHSPATWKHDCASECGYESLQYALGAAKPASAGSFPPNCGRAGLPSGALIVDNLPPGTPSKRANCSPTSTIGSFTFNFPLNTAGRAPGKVDVHQLGSGFNGQFYFSHTRVPLTDDAFNGALDVSGTWNLGQSLNAWTQIYVHMPSHGAWLQQANYTISTGNKTVTRSVNQRNYANEWVSLGTLRVDGVPSITLANNTGVYTSAFNREKLSGVDDIAWDAVAFVPLAQKPTDFIVSLGDSYSSGEGTSAFDGSDFLRGSDHHGTPVRDTEGIDGPVGAQKDSPHRNACHRTLKAWPYWMETPGSAAGVTIGSRIQAGSPTIDHQMLACAGAETDHVVTRDTPGARQQYGELTQLDRGFLDENTTLVTLTIGGNDLGFGEIIITCVTQLECENAAAKSFDGTLGEMVDSRLLTLSDKVNKVLQQVNAKAPNAKVLLLGYPRLFASNSNCVSVSDQHRGWLNEVGDRLHKALSKAAADAGSYVTYQDPDYKFWGKTLCTFESGIQGIVLGLTAGDSPLLWWDGFGPDVEVGTSAQSIHPNVAGAQFYAAAGTAAHRLTRHNLTATLVGGAPTTYYSSFRLHAAGPASMNVSSFGACGNEIRFGLRRNDSTSSGVFGQQHTNTLSWTAGNNQQNFVSTSSGESYVLPAGWYALNGRLTAGCPGGNTQTWQAQLYL